MSAYFVVGVWFVGPINSYLNKSCRGMQPTAASTRLSNQASPLPP